MTRRKHGGRRPGAGRPPSDNPALERVTIRLTGDDYTEIVQGAERMDLKVAEVVRLGALAYVRARR